MYIKKSVIALLLVVALLLGGSAAILACRMGVGNAVMVSKEDREKLEYYESSYAKLDYMKNFLETTYYTDVDSEALLENAYRGLVAGLNDEYSTYVSAEEYERYLQDVTGEYSGVGMSFYSNEDGVLEIVQVYKNSPAAKAGMQPGDLLLEVDGVAFTGQQSSEAATNIRGKEGTSVTVTRERAGVKEQVTMIRAKIQVETVSYHMLEDGIGYIQIQSFESATAKDFKAALDDITAQGAKGFVVDLRNNGGGLVDKAVEIADMLMDQGTVVYTEDHNKKRGYYTSAAGRTALPYVILVNEYTASASEILAAGVQDNNEGKVVGTRTFGKGIIQGFYPVLSDGSGIKLTIMQYFTASGKAIHGVGITPDYEVQLVAGDATDYQLQKALEVLK